MINYQLVDSFLSVIISSSSILSYFVNPFSKKNKIQITNYIAPGMPSLRASNKAVSFFEFWPTWVMYLPVLLCSLYWGIRYRGYTLPLIANPTIYLSGLTNFSKTSLLKQGNDYTQQFILPSFTYQCSEKSIVQQTEEIVALMELHGYQFPIVGKPDLGCRGTGVKLLKNIEELSSCLAHYPVNSIIVIQTLSDWEPEAGVFYIRHPDQEYGSIFSLSFKYSPYVLGDGVSTLAELLDKNPRIKKLKHLYKERVSTDLATVIVKNEPYKLLFSASHSKGAIFTNGNAYITQELEQSIDKIMRGIPNFHYGRLDIKFKHIDDFKRGENLAIIEINAANSEALHIWDKDTSLFDSMKTLIQQFKHLYQIGYKNRMRGCNISYSILELLNAWLTDKKLMVKRLTTD